MFWFPIALAFFINFQCFVNEKLIIIILGIIMTCAEITQHIVMSKRRTISPQHSRQLVCVAPIISLLCTFKVLIKGNRCIIEMLKAIGS
jgi:uncharacterized membrane protein YecN with MAPEG domain